MTDDTSTPNEKPDPPPDPDGEDSAPDDPDGPAHRAEEGGDSAPVDDPATEQNQTPAEERETDDESAQGLPLPDFTTVRVRMFNVTWVFYVVMGIIGVTWMNYQGILHERLSTFGRSRAITDSLLLGAGIAAVVVLAGVAVQRMTDWANAFEKEFAPLLNVFSYAQVPVVAFVSAAGEELLFRGALQESIGLLASAVVFGLIHFPWKRILIPWPFFAFVIGLLFGFVTQWTGSLFGPVLGHFLINLVNINLIKYRHPMDEETVLDEIM